MTRPYYKPYDRLKLLGNAFKTPLNESYKVIVDKATDNDLSLICLIFFFPGNLF